MADSFYNERLEYEKLKFHNEILESAIRWTEEVESIRKGIEYLEQLKKKGLFKKHRKSGSKFDLKVLSIMNGSAVKCLYLFEASEINSVLSTLSEYNPPKRVKVVKLNGKKIMLVRFTHLYSFQKLNEIDTSSIKDLDEVACPYCNGRGKISHTQSSWSTHEETDYSSIGFAEEWTGNMPHLPSRTVVDGWSTTSTTEECYLCDGKKRINKLSFAIVKNKEIHNWNNWVTWFQKQPQAKRISDLITSVNEKIDIWNKKLKAMGVALQFDLRKRTFTGSTKKTH